MEQEFERLHFLKRDRAESELANLHNPKRFYIKPLLHAESKEIKVTRCENER